MKKKMGGPVEGSAVRADRQGYRGAGEVGAARRWANLSSAAMALSIGSDGGPSSGPPIFFFMVIISLAAHIRSPGN